MNNNNNNNIESVYTVSNSTAKMIDLYKEFASLQERIIRAFENSINGEDVAEATAVTFNALRDAIAANVKENVCNFSNNI